MIEFSAEIGTEPECEDFSLMPIAELVSTDNTNVKGKRLPKIFIFNRLL